jgi:hypothetical protein
MGGCRAHGPTGQARRPQAHDRRARDFERNFLRAVDRLPMAGAAQRPAAEEHSVGRRGARADLDQRLRSARARRDLAPGSSRHCAGKSIALFGIFGLTLAIGSLPEAVTWFLLRPRDILSNLMGVRGRRTRVSLRLTFSLAVPSSRCRRQLEAEEGLHP